MNNTLENIAKKFGNSVPIYKGKLSSDGERINLELKEQYNPDEDDYSDPVEKQVCKAYGEMYNRGLNKFETNINLPHVYEEMVSEILENYVKYSPLKNPKQTTLYKWLRSAPEYNHPSREAFIALYRYIANSIHGKGFNSSDGHIKNMLAILEMIRDKHEK